MKAAALPRFPDPELSALVARMRGGDPRAREDLFLSLVPLVLRAARRHRFDGLVNVEDVTQEGLLGLWRALPYYRESTAGGLPCPALPVSAAAWAEQHVKAFVGQEVKRSLRYRAAGLAPDDDGPTWFDLVPVTDPGPEDGDLAPAVRAAVDELPRAGPRWSVCGSGSTAPRLASPRRPGCWGLPARTSPRSRGGR